jgi:CheY-like chemotaxis protein
MSAVADAGTEAVKATALPAILFVEDDADDFVVAKHELNKLNVRNPIHRVFSNDMLMDYLDGMGPYADRQKFPMPAVIMLDLRLPGITGLQIQAKLRVSLKLRHICIVMISSPECLTALKSAVQLGADGYMVKPFSADAFARLCDVLNLQLDIG